GHPEHVGPGGCELALNEVRPLRRAGRARRGGRTPATGDADDAVLAHQTGHALLADADHALLEVRVDPKRAVRAVRLGVRSSDGSDDLGVTLGPRGRWALQPGVEAAPGDSEDLGHA